MWVLVAISILIGDPSGISSVSDIKFNTEKTCQEAVSRIENEAKTIRHLGAYHGTEARKTIKVSVFCIYDGPFAFYLENK